MGWRETAACVAIGVAIGCASAFVILGNGELLGRESRQGWFGNANAGSTAADPYTRAIIAKIGLLALSRAETIYFHIYADAAGKRLDDRCAYELRGGALPARWWSITVYAGDDFLPVNGDDAQSIDVTRLTKAPDGRWSARVAATRDGAKNWISTKNAGRFSLGLRMYNPADAARATIDAIDFPEIRTISCAGAAS